MKLLLDEQLPREIAAALRERGHDVVAVQERPDLIGLDDANLLDIAHREGRAVVTNDVHDFPPLGAQLVASGSMHAGIVLLPGTYRRRRSDIGRLVRALDRLLAGSDDDRALENQQVWI